MPPPTPRYEALTTYRRDLEDLPPTAGSPFELVRGTAETLEAFHAANPKGLRPRKLEVLRSRLGTDEQTWLVRDGDGQWVGWCHTVRGSGPNSRIGHTLRLRPDEVFLFDDRTLVAHQRRGVHRFTILARMEMARRDGMTGAVTTISDSNGPSRASYGRLGFTRRSRLLHVPRLGRTVEVPAASRLLRGVAGGRRGRR
ncbi:hypothetical protein KC207_02425 [Phycicoccus sp. BSK3Z-2]|uniref:N-acetyltransferase domain-containing protein n=1 Tax=Phycicoccus avicenniae TaxID=2828860 RepID=A0A941HXS2_9MICO|nr:hypothetical protein [Phycicoccus avicenniae]MBR7742148.1 hypothetical protein [Phycicoccus avicenniae]